jgi:hypothetical protein
MIESRERRVLWPDVTKDTFARFCEFAYLQDYTPPSFQRKPQFEACKNTNEGEPESELPKNHEFWDGWETWTSLQRKKREKIAARRGIPQFIEGLSLEENAAPEEVQFPEAIVSVPLSDRTISEVNLRNTFLNLDYTSARPTQPFDPTSNSEEAQDFTPVFLGHAELYVLADKYDVQSLRQLVLYKLHDTFRNFTIHDTDVAGILAFTRFAYENTPRQAEGVASLRKLATCYLASILGQIGNREDFKQLLLEGGDFVADFWSTVWNADRSISPF